MRIKNKVLGQPNVELIIFPRTIIKEDGSAVSQDIVLKAQAVLDYKEFHDLVPEPKKRIKKVNRGGKISDVDDLTNQTYLEEKEKYAQLHICWIVLKSLAVNSDLIWDSVDLNKPETWPLWEKELLEAGFSQIEKSRLLQAVMSANGLDDARIEEARSNFLASQSDQEV